MKRAIIYGRVSTNKQSAESIETQMSLETRLANINQQINFVDKTQEIKEYVEHLKTTLENATDEVKFAFLKQTVHSIVLTPQKAEVFVYMSAPPTRGRLYKDRLPNIVHGEALFTLDIQQSNCPSNINRGVPRDMIDKQLKVFTDNGLSLVSFETSPILEFNINGK